MTLKQAALSESDESLQIKFENKNWLSYA